MKKLVLYGASGFAREIVWMIEEINKKKETYEFLGYIVDEEYYKENFLVAGYPVLGTSSWLLEHKNEVFCTVAIGEKPKAREYIQENLEAQGVKFETLISPMVRIHKSVQIGDGSVICGGVSISVDVTIGKGVVLNGLCCLGHDVIIDDYSCLMTRATLSGNVKVGKRCLFGGNTYVIPKVKIGNDAVVAAGSVVFTKVKDNTHVMGNPAMKFC